MTDDEKKPGTEPTAEPSPPASSQFTAAEVNLGRDRTNQPESADGGDVQQKETGRRGKRGLLLVAFGIIMGVAAALIVPRYAGPYLRDLPVALSQDIVTVGTVIEKHVEDERLVLRVSSEDGVALAIFTENLGDIDLLIEKGDQVELGAGHYEPFLHDPAIRRVRPTEARAVPPPVPAAPFATASEDATAEDATEEDPLPQTESRAADEARLAFEERMDAQLAELESQIMTFKQQRAGTGDTITDAARRHLEALDRHTASTRAKLEELKDASQGAWQDLRVGLDAAWSELRAAFVEAGSHFEENQPTDADDSGPSPSGRSDDAPGGFLQDR